MLGHMEMEIYSNIKENSSQEPSADTNWSPQAYARSNQQTVCRIVGVCFGLLCLLLMTLNISLHLHLHYMMQTSDADEEQELLRTNEETGQLPINSTHLAEKRDTQFNYTSVYEDSDSNYTDLFERDLLQTNSTDLVEQIDLCLTRYRNLTDRKKLLLISFNNLAKEKNQLLTFYKNLAEEKNQLDEERNRFHQSLVNAGWKRFRSSIYFFSNPRRRTWYGAREDCKQRGAELVIINSKEEQNFLSTRQIGSWIGLTDREREGVWKWLDGTPLTKGYWMPNEPNDFRGNEDCTHYYKSKWNDESCSRKIMWTCEKQLGRV